MAKIIFGRMITIVGILIVSMVVAHHLGTKWTAAPDAASRPVEGNSVKELKENLPVIKNFLLPSYTPSLDFNIEKFEVSQEKSVSAYTITNTPIIPDPKSTDWR